MLNHPQISLHRLLLSVSRAVDQVHPSVADHQQRVAYMATSIARQLGIKGADLLDVFQAALLHDIGLITPEIRIAAARLRDLESIAWHSEVGYQLLKTSSLFAGAAAILRDHHVPWGHGAGATKNGRAVPLAAHIITLADKIETSIDRDVPILEQVSSINEQVIAGSGEMFHPECVDAFLEVASRESFWLDVVTTHIGSLLTDRIDWPVLTIDEASLGPVAEIFGRLVDLASPWTAVHSAGVTATAAALARLMHFSPREQQLMRAAGYLHDIGKLSVPSAILDKPGKLTREEFLVVKAHTYHTYHILEAIGGLTQVSEWAAFHHERLDGRGYPFHLGDDELTLGSRIMAVADVLTAITEDRPYRKGMDRAEAMSVINKLVDKGGLDGQVVRVLEAHYDEIVDERQLVQAEYGAMQSILTNIVQGPADAHQSVLAGVGNAIT